MGVSTLFENEDYLIVNKPFDMYINSEDENEKNSVTYNIAKHDSHHSSSTHPLHFVHRLDYATSGVLCIAKNKSSSAAAGKLFEKRDTKKYYLAVVRQHVQYEICDIDFPVAADPLTAGSSHKMVAMTSPPGSPETSLLQPRLAQTRLLLLETGYYGTDPVSVVLLKPVTGRRHQLRVHCSAIGHTILGDYTYSNKEDSAPHRMFLHAMRLILPLPQETLDVQTADPFFSDQNFTSKYRALRTYFKYRMKEDFRKACEVTDQALLIGVKYKLFKPN
ncbi:hypothetical protein MSG28_016100 [Choristoneura fumiferana]|uniref:Uncharacterized protein n=1 Tax=Choristoneura fumiferana TaxID=7141 RepID=A0ACC0K595_CHOFU|nr:hypothetical protein MSG28_016100 [Choristoneura fumiferana]